MKRLQQGGGVRLFFRFFNTIMFIVKIKNHVKIPPSIKWKSINEAWRLKKKKKRRIGRRHKVHLFRWRHLLIHGKCFFGQWYCYANAQFLSEREDKKTTYLSHFGDQKLASDDEFVNLPLGHLQKGYPNNIPEFVS